MRFWEKLHKVLQEEPTIDEFRPMTGMLANLGIEPGKPSVPDARMSAILERAAKIGRDQMLVAGYASARLDRFVWPDRKYAALRYENGDFELPTGMDLEARTAGSRKRLHVPEDGFADARRRLALLA